MSEFRQDPTTGRWVIIAPERGRRPHTPGADLNAAAIPAARIDPNCPFCPGNERLLPGIIEETPCPEPPGWLTRVVPNKYAALDAGTGPIRKPGEAGEILPGHGFHEVIVETPDHDTDLAALSDRRLGAVLATYQRRYAALMAEPGINAVLIFRNHGPAGGASLTHPHSQVIATPFIPPHLAEMAAWGRAGYEADGTCVTCALIPRELDDGRRVLEATDRFVTLVPFAAASPFEVWVLPRRHQASFADADDPEIGELAALLGRVLRRIGKALDNPPYTYAIQSAPLEPGDAPYQHWRMRIVPSVVTPGGFEIGGGLPINPSSPESDAEALRSLDPAS